MAGPPMGGILGTLPVPSGLGGSLASGGGPSAIHFWPMNEGTGTSLVDHIGSTNLTASNLVWATTPTGMGSSSKIAAFDGTTSYAQAASVDSSLNFSGSTPFTFAVWVDLGSTSSMTIAGNLTAPTTYEGWEVGCPGGGNANLLLVNNVTSNQLTANTSTAPFGLSTPVLLTVTYTGSLTLAGIVVYVNGVSQAISDASGTLSSSFTSTVPFLVGRRADGTSYFSGALAYMRVWNQALTSTQVTALYSAGPV